MSKKYKIFENLEKPYVFQSNKCKKGAAAQTALFVLVMALLIILYILFVPPETRLKMLGDNESEEGGGTAAAEEENLLLSENIGHLDYLNLDEYEFTIPSFYLIATARSKTLLEENPFYLKSDWFNQKAKTIEFTIDDYENTDNVILTFNSNKHSGLLTIIFNGYTIYEDELTTVNSPPINIRKEYLKEKNVLGFEVGGVGAAFWSANEYSIQDLKIIGSVTDISQQQARNVFTLTTEQFNNLETAELKFFPDCTIYDIGTLSVNLNGNQLVSSIPDCIILNRFAVPNDYLKAGQNVLVFSAEKGSYLVDQIKIKITLKEETVPIYYFDLTQEQFDGIQNETEKLNLTIKFVDDDKNKEAEIMVNGHTTALDTYDAAYTKIIPRLWIESKKNNYITITPKSTMDIVELRLEVQEIE